MSLLLRLERKQKAFVKSLSNSHIHLELKHTLRSSLKNHTRFQTKMGKVYTRFQTEKAHKPWPVGKPGLDSTLDWTGLFLEKAIFFFQSRVQSWFSNWPTNPTLWGGTYLYGLYKGYPPPPRGAQLVPAI